MLRFRPPSPIALPGAVTDLLAVGQQIDDAMMPGHFFIAPELRLTWIAAKAETIPWELFRGRLLDAAHTRATKTFLCWHLTQDQANEPMISVKLDVHDRQIHVTRGLLSYVWKGYDAGAGVIESRETTRWTRELVGTISLAEFADLESVRDELICLIWQAVVGTSRLPLTSVESPLPAFSFGQLHYLYRSDAGGRACASWKDWMVRGFHGPSAWCETVKLFEFVLRQPPEQLAWLDEMLGGDRPPFAQWKRSLMSSLFNSVSLSPHTHFLDSALAQYSGLTLLLRKICLHLTAYDLVTFHHRGANYPDAILLDTALHRYIEEIELWGSVADAEDCDGRWLRRSLRQACLLRQHYQGHLVPDVPTSPGENARVMPVPRVPQEQLTQSLSRRRALFADEPLPTLLDASARKILKQSVQDLVHLDERVEMGLGLFIDRPLGYAKEVGEPDLTPLLAHEGFSPSLARRRWHELKKLCADLAIPFDPALDDLFANGPWPAGLAHAELAECPRPTAALCDVRKVADDFVILRTRPIGLLRMLGYFDLALPDGKTPRLCVQAVDEAKQPKLVLFDEQLRQRVELIVDVSEGYRTRAGVELPRAGLRAAKI